MLSIMRRHVGWGLKVVLAVVIVTFVFFFGYTTIRQQAPDSTALRVGDEEISLSQYRFVYNDQYDLFREKFAGGEMPAFVLDSISQSAARQLVQRSLLKQFANSLGFGVSDAELAERIRREENFDPAAYRNFLQYFYRQNGFSYEDWIRDDLLIQKFQAWAQKIEPPPPVSEPAPQTSNVKKNDDKKADEKKAPAQTTLVDLWYQDFARKTDVKSFIQDTTP